MTNDGGGSGAPRFDVVLRGYDRRQVDEHVARMQRIIGRLRADLEVVRSQPLPIVAPADMPIEQNGAQPGPGPRPQQSQPGDSPDVVGSFTDRMQSILQSAEEEAAEIRRKAHASARSELHAARAEVADLSRQRDIMITELNRLRGQLESMLSAPTARMAAVARTGTPSPTRREGRPRPSPTPRTGATPSPVGRQAVTGPQQVSPPPPPSAPDNTAAPAVVDKPAPEATPKPASDGPAVNGAPRDDSDGPGAQAEAALPEKAKPAAEPAGSGEQADVNAADVNAADVNA
ncbi:MAG: hypothetical protein L0H84_02745, partial [Pseudonocardia sp.]|nr:hypothetical protein [Pseudonocardia sp.]